jgi:tRNA U55 pseudouridine synthase TruB
VCVCVCVCHLTYAHVGKACGTHAHMTGLVRLKQGSFTLLDCLHVHEWTYDKIESHIVKIEDIK